MRQNTKALEVNTKRLEKLKEVIAFMLENPDLNRGETATAMGMSIANLSKLLHTPELLRILRDGSHKKVLSMLPLAVKGFQDSLQSRNDKIKYLSSTDLLKSEKVLGPERIDLTIQDNSERTVEELKAMIEEAQKIPSPTIDAELIG